MLQEMFMGGSPEWNQHMVGLLKNFDINSQELKDLFCRIGSTPEEVISKVMANPDVAKAFQKPIVQAAIMECCQDSRNIIKYHNNKQVMDVFGKILDLFPVVTGRDLSPQERPIPTIP